MKRFSLYGVISVISIIVRQFFLPNPFDCFGDKAVLINWIVEPILHLIAYGLVGLVYCRGSFPAIGSIMYLVTYAALVGVLWLMGIFAFAWWWVTIIVVALSAIIFGLNLIASKHDGYFD